MRDDVEQIRHSYDAVADLSVLLHPLLPLDLDSHSD